MCVQRAVGVGFSAGPAWRAGWADHLSSRMSRQKWPVSTWWWWVGCDGTVTVGRLCSHWWTPWRGFRSLLTVLAALWMVHPFEKDQVREGRNSRRQRIIMRSISSCWSLLPRNPLSSSPPPQPLTYPLLGPTPFTGIWVWVLGHYPHLDSLIVKVMLVEYSVNNIEFLQDQAPSNDNY